jgi:hypothetical protein
VAVGHRAGSAASGNGVKAVSARKPGIQAAPFEVAGADPAHREVKPPSATRSACVCEGATHAPTCTGAAAEAQACRPGGSQLT